MAASPVVLERGASGARVTARTPGARPGAGNDLPRTRSAAGADSFPGSAGAVTPACGRDRSFPRRGRRPSRPAGRRTARGRCRHGSVGGNPPRTSADRRTAPVGAPRRGRRGGRAGVRGPDAARSGGSAEASPDGSADGPPDSRRCKGGRRRQRSMPPRSPSVQPKAARRRPCRARTRGAKPACPRTARARARATAAARRRALQRSTPVRRWPSRTPHARLRGRDPGR